MQFSGWMGKTGLLYLVEILNDTFGKKADEIENRIYRELKSA